MTYAEQFQDLNEFHRGAREVVSDILAYIETREEASYYDVSTLMTEKLVSPTEVKVIFQRFEYHFYQEGKRYFLSMNTPESSPWWRFWQGHTLNPHSARG